MLSRPERLKTSSEFNTVYRLKRSVANSLLILYVGKKNTSESLTKVGIVVGKKVSKRANKRNYIKRIIREAYKRAKECSELDAKEWESMIILARPDSLEVDFKEVYDSIIDCIKKARKRF